MLDGLVQTEDYARWLLETSLGATPDVIAARLASRMQRQQRVLYRDEPPMIMFVVDEPSLYRLVGTRETMAAQMRHLLTVARLPHVSLQVLPSVGHPVSQSSLVVTDSAAYAEHLFGGYTYTDPETVTAALRMFTKIQTESDKGSESLAKIERTAELWTTTTTGVSPATAVPTAASA